MRDKNVNIAHFDKYSAAVNVTMSKIEAFWKEVSLEVDWIQVPYDIESR